MQSINMLNIYFAWQVYFPTYFLDKQQLTYWKMQTDTQFALLGYYSIQDKPELLTRIYG